MTFVLIYMILLLDQVDNQYRGLFLTIDDKYLEHCAWAILGSYWVQIR